MRGEIQHSGGISKLVIVPGDDLEEVLSNSHTSGSVDDRRSGVGDEILADNHISGVAENSLHVSLGRFQEGLADLLIRGGLTGPHDEVNN